MAPAKAGDSKGDYPALSLYQLIGAPLHALVDAEAQAALTTADFIRQVGFTGDARGGGDMGDLRMARFVQERPGQGGAVQRYEVRVPLLSMLPIPALQIQDAELDFFVRVIDTFGGRGAPPINAEGAAPGQPARPGAPAAGEAAEKPAPNASAEAPLGLPRLSERIDFRAVLGRKPEEGPGGRGSLEMLIRMKIRVAQADVPSGLARLFNLMDQGVSAAEAPPSPAPAQPGGAGDEPT